MRRRQMWRNSKISSGNSSSNNSSNNSGSIKKPGEALPPGFFLYIDELSFPHTRRSQLSIPPRRPFRNAGVSPALLISFASLPALSSCQRFSKHVYGCKKPRWPAHASSLLKRIGDLNKRRIAPSPPEERNPHRHIDIRIPRHRGKRRAPARIVVARQMICEPRRPGGRRNERVKLVLIHHAVDSLRTREPVIEFQRVSVSLIRKRPFRFGLQHDVLPKERHLFFAIALVELDDFFERVHRHLGTGSRKIGVQVGLELI